VTREYINQDFPLKDLGYSNALGSSSIARHRWYFVKEAFSPLIVDKALADSGCSSDDVIIDPFCGSGTVPLQACVKGNKSIGFEVNPFLAFVSRIKLHQLAPVRIKSSLGQIIANARIGRPSALETYSTFSQAGGEKKWLFNQEVLRAFEGGWIASSQYDEPLRDILRLALIGSAMDCCNATRDGKCLRYKQNWLTLGFDRDLFIDAFERRIGEICHDMVSCPVEEDHSSIESGDCRSIVLNGRINNFKLCITSPPYLNSFDYSDIYRPELFLGKFVTSTEQLMQLRLKTVRSHVQAMWEPPVENSFGRLYSDAMEKVTARKELLWNNRIPLMIQAYFEDMSIILRRLRERSSPTGNLWLVVSTSAYAGVEIPVDLIISDIAVKSGWFLREIGVLRHLRTSSHHWSRWAGPGDEPPRLRESVVLLDASPSKLRFKGR
jgi:hypothetical protein